MDEIIGIRYAHIATHGIVFYLLPQCSSAIPLSSITVATSICKIDGDGAEAMRLIYSLISARNASPFNQIAPVTVKTASKVG